MMGRVYGMRCVSGCGNSENLVTRRVELPSDPPGPMICTQEQARVRCAHRSTEFVEPRCLSRMRTFAVSCGQTPDADVSRWRRRQSARLHRQTLTSNGVAVSAK